MKSVALAQRVLRRIAQSATSVEQAIGHIHGPRDKRKQEWDPQRETHAPGPCKSQRPDNGHRGRIETGQMPKGKRPQRARSRKTVDAVCVPDAVRSAVLRRRWSEGKRHSFNFN
jgi:hypothetical protein